MIYSLEKGKGSLQVLVYLYLYGPTVKTKLSAELTPCFETLSRTLSILQDMRLVVTRNEPRFPFRQVVQLSPAGRQLVETPVHTWPSLFWQWYGVGLLPPRNTP